MKKYNTEAERKAARSEASRKSRAKARFQAFLAAERRARRAASSAICRAKRAVRETLALFLASCIPAILKRPAARAELPVAREYRPGTLPRILVKPLAELLDRGRTRRRATKKPQSASKWAWVRAPSASKGL